MSHSNREARRYNHMAEVTYNHIVTDTEEMECGTNKSQTKEKNHKQKKLNGYTITKPVCRRHFQHLSANSVDMFMDTVSIRHVLAAAQQFQSSLEHVKVHSGNRQ